MKKSELKKLIKEEIHKVLKENEDSLLKQVNDFYENYSEEGETIEDIAKVNDEDWKVTAYRILGDYEYTGSEDLKELAAYLKNKVEQEMTLDQRNQAAEED